MYKINNKQHVLLLYLATCNKHVIAFQKQIMQKKEAINRKN